MRADATPLAVCIFSRKGRFLQLIKRVVQAKFLTCTGWQSISRLFQGGFYSAPRGAFSINQRDFATLSFWLRRRFCPRRFSHACTTASYD